MGVIIFNGESSLDYRIQVESPPDYKTNPREFETVHIPGRNGDLLIDKGGYQNTVRVYPISTYSPYENFTELASKISSWLNAPSTYCRLEDSYEPEYFRMAIYGNSLELTNLFHKAGKGNLEFYCKPQRFLKSGERVKRFTGAGYINNPTRYDSHPVITIYGSGNVSLSIGYYSIQVKDLNGFITIDSDIQDCYQGSINKNDKVTLSNGFPNLIQGRNNISWTGSGITSVEVMPRWWIL